MLPNCGEVPSVSRCERVGNFVLKRFKMKAVESWDRQIKTKVFEILSGKVC